MVVTLPNNDNKKKHNTIFVISSACFIFDLKVCDGLLGLATLYFQKDNMLEAKKLTTRALELATNVIGRKHHFVSDIYTKVMLYFCLFI